MRNTCWRCHRPEKNCLCPHIKSIPSRTRFLFLMHPMEARKEKMGTGRLCLAALPNSRLFVDVDFTRDAGLMAECRRPGTVTALLYPGPTSLNLSDVSPRESFLPPGHELQIIVVDGTWPCAKKIMKLNPWLLELPRVSFTPGRVSEFHIKQQPDKLCLSSIEAVHQVLDDLDRHGHESLGGTHHCLPEVLAQMVKFQIECANDPTIPSYRPKKGFRPPETRVLSRKWESRNVFFLN